jgi:hypothetical protein
MEINMTLLLPSEILAILKNDAQRQGWGRFSSEDLCVDVTTTFSGKVICEIDGDRVGEQQVIDAIEDMRKIRRERLNRHYHHLDLPVGETFAG